jgi:hypothetical protein
MIVKRFAGMEPQDEVTALKAALATERARAEAAEARAAIAEEAARIASQAAKDAVISSTAWYGHKRLAFAACVPYAKLRCREQHLIATNLFERSPK